MKTKLTDPEFSTLTLGMARAIEVKFELDHQFNVYLTSSDVEYQPETGFEVFTLQVIVTKKDE